MITPIKIPPFIRCTPIAYLNILKKKQRWERYMQNKYNQKLNIPLTKVLEMDSAREPFYIPDEELRKAGGRKRGQKRTI